MIFFKDLDSNILLIDSNNESHLVEELRAWAGDELASLVENKFEEIREEAEDKYSQEYYGRIDELSGEAYNLLEILNDQWDELEDIIESKSIKERKSRLKKVLAELEPLFEFLEDGI